MADYTIQIKHAKGQVICKPELQGGVKPGQTVEWKCNEPHWAVVFGPDAPFVPEVLGSGVGQSEATVFAKRPGDFHKHKYVVFVWANSKLVSAAEVQAASPTTAPRPRCPMNGPIVGLERRSPGSGLVLWLIMPSDRGTRAPAT